MPPDADPADVRHERRIGIPADRDWRYWLLGTLFQPLDWAVCPMLHWGCRYLTVDHRPLVAKVWDDKVMAALRSEGGDRSRSWVLWKVLFFDTALFDSLFWTKAGCMAPI